MPNITTNTNIIYILIHSPVQLRMDLACVASVSVWFRSKKRPWKGIFGFEPRVLIAREIKREPKNERRGRGRGRKETFPPRSFTCAIFRAVFDSCSSFFAPKPHRKPTDIGVRAGGARGAAAPPNFGQLRFFGQHEKIWAKPGEINIFYFNLTSA